MLKSTGVVRKVDELGRIVIPIELRRTLDIAQKDYLEVFVEGDRVILRKYAPTCIFCENTESLVPFKGKSICPACLAQLRRADD